MRIKMKRLLGILISLALAIGMMPGMSLTAYAADLTSATTTWETGSYEVPADGVTIANHITVNGIVNLTLTAGTTLTASQGITISDGARLNVSGEGAMVVKGSNENANSTVAGGGKLVLKSGTLTVTGGNGAGVGDDSTYTDRRQYPGGNAINGTVIVNGGTLTATGGNGGGVGAYSAYSYGAAGGVAVSGSVTVNAGAVTVTGGNGGSIGARGAREYGGAGGAAIGGDATVNGGKLTATNGTHGVNGDGSGGDGGASYNGTLTLGTNVKLYEGTGNNGTVLDGNDSSSRVYSGAKKSSMYAEGPDFTPHTHNFTYVANGATITATCAGIDGNGVACTLENLTATLTIVGSDTGAKFEGDTDDFDPLPMINYYSATDSDERGEALDPITSAPTVPGKYWAEITLGEGTVHVVYEIKPKASIGDQEYATFQEAIDAVSDGETIKLNDDVKGTYTFNKSGVTVTLDLNGHTIDGDQQTTAIMISNGTVILNDTSEAKTGEITGAKQGVAVNGGTFKLEEGKIQGNIGNVNGAGVSVANGATFEMSGGAIQYNQTSTYTGGVLLNGGATFIMSGGAIQYNSGAANGFGGIGSAGVEPQFSGTAVVRGNVINGTVSKTETGYTLTGGTPCDVRNTDASKKIVVSAALTTGAKIGVYNYVGNNAITTGYNTYNESDKATKFFFSNAEGKSIAKNDDGELIFVDYTGPDKTALNDAITAAETLYNSIKENLDYEDITSTLKTAIDTAKAVAGSDEVDQDTVNAAAAAITTAKTTAVVGMLNALSAASDVTTADKDAIEAARAAYDSLSDTEKAKVDNDTLKKLTDAETALAAAEKEVADTAAANTASEAINNLPVASDVTTSNKEAIETARKAYNDLTEDQKKKVSAETLKKLTDVEEALAAALEVAAVSEAINALPSADSVTIDNKDAVKDARVAYNALTDKQKEKITAETLKKLTDAESALAAVTVSDTIDDLPSAINVATDHKDAIEKARAAFDALSAEQKEQVSTDTLSKLKVCELALAIAELPEANTVTTNDKPAIEAVRESFKNLTPEQQAKVPTAVLAKLQACELVITIGELPEANAVTTANKKAIEDARSAYNSLNDEQKNKISADALLKLELAEIALAIAELPDADKVTGTDKATIEAASANYKKLTNEQRTKIGDVAATKLEAVEAALKIAELPEENAVTTTNKDAIEAAREAYDKLSDAQKSQVGETFKSKLEANEVALAKKLIEAIPDPGEITTGDTEKVVAAKTAYDKLSDAQKENISEAEKDKIAAAEQAIKDTAAAQTAIDKLNALPAAADITAANRDNIVAARAAYDALTDEQKAKVTADTLNKLTAAEVKLAQIAMSEVSAKSDSDVVFTGNSIQLINTPTTALSEGQRIVYAVTTENEAPADSLYTADIPVGTGAGTYHVWYKVVDAENHDVTTPSHVAVTIEKGNSSSSGSQANTSSEESGLIYSGHPQELVTAGTAEGGTMVYALGEDGDHAPANEKFSEEIPKGTEAKTYYVWYKVKGDANHSDTTPVCIPVTITAVDVKADTMIVSEGKDTSVGTEKPQVSDGLKEQAVSEATSSNKKVVLNLIITPQGQDEVSDSAYIKSDEQMHSQVKSQYKDEGLVSVDVLDIYIEKFVDENQEANVTKTDKVIEIGMAYDFTDKYDVVVVRDHEGSAQTFTALSSRPAAADYRDATFFADVPNNKLYIYSNLFSKYVVAYSTVEGNARPAAVASSSSSSSSEPTTVPVYRLFNKLTGTHFYTANKVERDLLLEQNANAGWIDEGIAFQTAVTSSTPVYRVFDATKGIHLYTADAATRDTYIASGCADEGIAWYAAVSVGRKVYKVSNPKNGYVLYTTSKAEADGLATAGFTSQEAEFVVY